MNIHLKVELKLQNLANFGDKVGRLLSILPVMSDNSKKFLFKLADFMVTRKFLCILLLNSENEPLKLKNPRIFKMRSHFIATPVNQHEFTHL